MTTSRVPGWQEFNDEGQTVAQPSAPTRQDEDGDQHIGAGLTLPPRVTAGMIDGVVEGVIRQHQYQPGMAEVLRGLMARDMKSAASHAYFSAHAVAARRTEFGAGHVPINVSYVLTDDNIRDLTEYAPEFKFAFRNVEDHDHPVAAICRKIDHKLIERRLPGGARIADVGGNPVHYAKQGNGSRHICGRLLDVKDQQRYVLRDASMKRIVAGSMGSASAAVAQRYLDKDETLVCGKSAQECGQPADVLVAIHVYDIPMRDWPKIMDSKGAQVVEGCLLFSNNFFDKRAGTLGVTGARYEIDASRDEFRMGFSGSPSWWYTHKWSELMLYGADQLIHGLVYDYAYKVIERRGDTLFFRIIRVDRPAEIVAPPTQHYRTPGVKFVQVDGFRLVPRGSSRKLGRQTYMFPESLWNEMFNQAAEDYERGVMSFDKMYNHYRTISVHQTINSVTIMGGVRVDPDDLVPFVVHVCLAAAGSCLLGQRSTRGILDVEMLHRNEGAQALIRKFFDLAVNFFGSIGLVLIAPIVLLGKFINVAYSHVLLMRMMQWKPVCQIKDIPASAVFNLDTAGVTYDEPTDMLRSYGRLNAPLDHYRAVVKDRSLAALIMDVNPNAEVTVEDVPTPAVSAPPSYATGDPADKEQERRGLTAQRQAAIREHIEEIGMMNRAARDACSRAYVDLSVLGRTPNMQALQRKAELYHNPDMWMVSDGIIVKSARGLNAEDFDHMAVYHPTPDPETDECIRTVFRNKWVDSGGTGGHTNYMLADTGFSGWVLTVDELKIFNGPEIISSMQSALLLPHDYSVVLHEGPPGCGKTYAILQRFESPDKDFISCPVRESADSTRDSLVEKFHGDKKLRKQVRTVDSYLTNRTTTDELRTTTSVRLFADECYMTHAGKWFAMAALMGVREIHAYGDKQQIPHVPRVQAPAMHVRITSDEVDFNYKIFRCPKEVVAMWSDIYEYRVRSFSDITGDVALVKTIKGRDVPKGCVMLCMYQADKIQLHQMFGRTKGVRIMTVHESEGKTFDHVWLFKFDLRARSDKRSLFDQQAYCLVAASRCRRSFVYVNPGSQDDHMSMRVKRAFNPKYVALAGDRATVGESIMP